MNEPIFVSPDRAAKLCGCSRRTVGEWLRNGTLPSRKVGGLRLILLSDLRAIGAEPAESRPPAGAP